MDKLKSAIADKVLEISSSEENTVKAKLERINRFRDFVNACQVLIRKYPDIEAELIAMVENNDFDTKIASSRVDSIIRLSENTVQNPKSHETIEKDISRLDEITEQLEEEKLNSETIQSPNSVIDDSNTDIVKDAPFIHILQEDPIQYQPEDIEYEEIEPLAIEANTPANESQEITEIPAPETMRIPVKDTYREPTIETPSSIRPQASPIKDNAKKGLQLVIVIVAIVAIIFIIVFVIRNLEAVLWSVGVGAIVVGIAWFLLKKRKNDETE